MLFWVVSALMTALAVFAVLWPLARPRAAVEARSGSDLGVYRDQLDEVERDRARGLIGDREAEAARIEVSRRLLAAAEAATATATAPGETLRRRLTAVLAIACVPLLAIGGYVAMGSPHLPDQPLAARLQGPANERPIEAVVAQVETHLARNPDDGRGWEVLGPVYMGLGRFDDAVRARTFALRLNGATADRHADLGEAIVAQQHGVVSAEAKAAFADAIRLDARHPKARFFTGLALLQDGRRPEAMTVWQALMADAPQDAPWLEAVRHALVLAARESAPPQAEAPPAPGPGAEEMAAAAAMPPAEREGMIRGMVERLATRLETERGDLDGWLRLVRAYVVLGERDKARAAAVDARRAAGEDPDKMRRVDDALRGLGLES